MVDGDISKFRHEGDANSVVAYNYSGLDFDNQCVGHRPSKGPVTGGDPAPGAHEDGATAKGQCTSYLLGLRGVC